MNNNHTITIRFPHALWVALRRLQEAGRIKSIQGAVIAAMTRFVEDRDNEA